MLQYHHPSFPKMSSWAFKAAKMSTTVSCDKEPSSRDKEPSSRIFSFKPLFENSMPNREQISYLIFLDKQNQYNTRKLNYVNIFITYTFLFIKERIEKFKKEIQL